ncbi:hypothetical protein RZS08_05470 [Arthrospira platensis SPKY1]|nr:hypothetical protein [Arthrospira platensis SPKY1]
MKEILFIGDIIASQISMYVSKEQNRNIKRLISNTSHDLISLSDSNLELTGIDEIWYSMGYSDFNSLSRIEFHGFKDRIENDIKQILSHNLPVLFIIPLLPSIVETDKEYIKTYNNVLDSIEEIISQYDINFFDLSDILDQENINSSYGINDEGLSKIIDYILVENLI